MTRIVALFLGLVLFCNEAYAQDGFGGPFASDSTAETSPQAEAETERTSLERRLAQWRDKSSEFERAIKEIPADLVKVAKEIDSLEHRAAVSISQTATLEELESQLAAAERDLALVRQKAGELDTEAARRLDRRKRVPELLAIAKSKLQSMAATTVVPSSSDPIMAVIRAQLHELRRSALLGEVDAYQKELLSFGRAAGRCSQSLETTRHSRSFVVRS